MTTLCVSVQTESLTRPCCYETAAGNSVCEMGLAFGSGFSFRNCSWHMHKQIRGTTSIGGDTYFTCAGDKSTDRRYVCDRNMWPMSQTLLFCSLFRIDSILFVFSVISSPAHTWPVPMLSPNSSFNLQCQPSVSKKTCFAKSACASQSLQ